MSVVAGRRVIRDETPPVEKRVPAGYWSRVASNGVLAGGIIMLFGVLVDIGVLWLLQRQATPQWEFTAIANTIEGVPRLVFGLGFLFAGLSLRGSTNALAYRGLAILLIGVGIFSIALAGLLVLSYFALGKLVTQPEVYTMLRSVAIKTLALSAVYAFVAIPFGVLSLRRPRR
ncbi:MAG TPA: hypothetical protein VK939_01975 [Longimicrobiales bacterium]|nr:hypothetical protein [Longimicrobiales bacterium]